MPDTPDVDALVTTISAEFGGWGTREQAEAAECFATLARKATDEVRVTSEALPYADAGNGYDLPCKSCPNDGAYLCRCEVLANAFEQQQAALTAVQEQEADHE